VGDIARIAMWAISCRILNIMGLGDAVGFESLKEGRASQRRVASLSFDAAGFGHGGPIDRDASTRFRNKWGKKSSP
jgi:hypothetical protein